MTVFYGAVAQFSPCGRARYSTRIVGGHSSRVVTVGDGAVARIIPGPITRHPYLHSAMSLGAIVVALDISPANEMLDDSCGVPIKATKITNHKTHDGAFTTKGPLRCVGQSKPNERRRKEGHVTPSKGTVHADA